MVVERTGCEDAWYGTLATTLRWYVERFALQEVPRDWIEGS
jgi:hypothetical protein